MAKKDWKDKLPDKITFKNKTGKQFTLTKKTNPPKTKGSRYA